ncbi:MAG: hypothetical protein K2X27_24540 [Candidatus Obscuribacterales bacterium]|nr:hypothetical protein [Candidatus Obscuribacterales bacterium]
MSIKMQNEHLAGNEIKAPVYLGFASLSSSALMLEILLTRVFSATMYYHFAFMAVAVAMFGLTFGSLLVYMLPGCFPLELSKKRVWQSTFIFSITAVVSMLIYSQSRIVLEYSLYGLASISLVYLLFSVPFLFVGIATSILLSRFPSHTAKLYACDLFGAGLACILIVLLLSCLDALSVMICIAVLAALSACFFSVALNKRRLQIASIAMFCLLVVLSVAQAISFRQGKAFVNFRYAKGEELRPALYEQWNPYSLIRVEKLGSKPSGWGLSNITPQTAAVEQLLLLIDTGAGTAITKFDGDLSKLQYLKYDVTNFANYLRPKADLLVIGVGGGRDLLSALVFGQRSILGVELNDSILHLLRAPLASFSGDLEKQKSIRLVNDEARSFVARSNQKWDIIEASLIDTWAASSAGAFALSENSIYTVEAWSNLLTHLKTRGVLSFSRWYDLKNPIEFYRLCSLGAESLRRSGVKDPRKQILAVVNFEANNDPFPAVGTLLLSPTPFSEEDLLLADVIAERMNFKVILSSKVCLNSDLEKLTGAKSDSRFYEESAFNLFPPEDNIPFFFNLKKPEYFGEFKKGALTGGSEVLRLSFFITGILTSLVLALPLVQKCCLRSWNKEIASLELDSAAKVPLAAALAYFALIGAGFILVELSLLQRLSIFLGHPVLSLAAVLFSFLTGGGLGSLLSSGLKENNLFANPKKTLLSLLFLLCLLSVGIGQICLNCHALGSVERILIAVLLSFSPAVFMGTVFPSGMKLSQEAGLKSHGAWFWAVNGAFGLLATVTATAISLSFGLAACLQSGILCYLLALLACRKLIKTV